MDMLGVADHARRCADVSAAIGPFIEQIDNEIADDYRTTFRRVVALDATLADARYPIRREWNAHYARTRVLRSERERIIRNAANIISILSPQPVVVMYLGERVHP